MKLYRHLLVLAILPSLGSCATLKRPQEQVVDIGVAPVAPPKLTPAEKRAMADIIASGQKVASKIEDQGSVIKSEDSHLNHALWNLSAMWSGPAEQPVAEVDSRLVVDLQGRLAVAVSERVKMEDDYATKLSVYQAHIDKLQNDNILLARSKQEVVTSLTRLEADAEKTNVLKERLAKISLGIGGVLGLAGVIFVFLRFGSLLGKIAFLAYSALYGSSWILFLWSYYRNTVLIIVIMAGCAIGAALLLYALWGAVLSKVFTSLVTSVQSGRQALATDHPQALATLDATLAADSNPTREKLVDKVKKAQNLPSVSQQVSAPVPIS